MDALKAIYAFKPGRTFAQAMAAQLVAGGTGILDTSWPQALSVAGMAGLISLLMLWADGGNLLSQPKATDEETQDPEQQSAAHRT